jgi:hypothetical protein
VAPQNGGALILNVGRSRTVGQSLIRFTTKVGKLQSASFSLTRVKAPDVTIRDRLPELLAG